MMRIKHPLAVYIVIDEKGDAETFLTSQQATEFRAWLRYRHKPSLDSTMRKYQLTVSRKEKKEPKR